MTALRTRILCGVAAVLAGTCAGRAQAQTDPTVFDPPAYFGTNERPQAGDAVKDLLQGYELARQFHGAERYRRVGAAVGNLHLLVEDAEGTRRAKYCTATLVSNDRILTNYHCAPGDDGWTPVAALLNLGFLQRNEMNGRFFRVQLPPIEANKELDYSVLAVDDNPADIYGMIELRDAELQTDKSLFIVHHPEGEPQRVSRLGCRALLSSELQADEFKHRCVTQAGSSGALIFTDEDPPRPVGLHYNGGRDVLNDSDSYNVAKRLTRLVTQSQELSRIKAALSALPLPDERLRTLEDFVFRIQSIRAAATAHFRGPSDTYELAAVLIKQANHPSATTSQLSFNGVLHMEGTSHQGAILVGPEEVDFTLV
jgi:hypothetical protein